MAAAQTARQLGAELPQDPRSFSGRQAELAQLRDEVWRPALGGEGPAATGRVLLVAGRAGSGRTTLAVRFARSVAADYPDGQFFVRMSEADGTRVPAHQAARLLLAALGVPIPTAIRRPDGSSGEGAQPAPPLADASADALADVSAAEGDGEFADADCVALRAALAARQAVVVLDDVRDAAQLRALLPARQGSLLVAVTARPLPGVADARPCVIGGLALPAATSLLVDLAGDTRIVCDPVAARALAENLACHPTALLLIGGWLRARPRASVTDALRAIAQTTPAATAVRLGKQPGAAEPGGAEPLRRAFGVVHGGLPTPAARLLRLLLLAPTGATDPRTASALLGCPVDAAAVHLATLAEQQLLVQEPGTGRHFARYRLPGCLRPPLGELLAADRPAETELARARLLERLTRLLTACVQLLAPGAAVRAEPLPGPLRFSGAAEAWEWLDTELPALRAAARVAAADGTLDGLAMRLVTTLVRALPLWAGNANAVAGELYEGHGLILELAVRGGLSRQRAAALVNLGDLHAGAGEHDRALERYRSALGPARAADDQVAVGRILEAVAGAYRASGDLVRATDWYGRALALRRTRGEQRDELRLLGRLASAQTAQGRLADALRSYRSAVELHRRSGDEDGAVAAALGAARVEELAGRPEQALQTQREALEWTRRAGGRAQAQVLLRMAEVLERAGDPAGARLHREQAAALGAASEPAAGQPARQPAAQPGTQPPVQRGAGEAGAEQRPVSSG